MPSWVKRHAAAQQIDILLFDAFSNHCLANTLEPLRAANGVAGRELYRWRVLTMAGGHVTSSSGLEVSAQGQLGQSQGDVLIVMPSYNARAHAGPVTRRALRAAAGRYRALAGFDMGSWLLADAGLLDDSRATIHWDELDRFAEAFPLVEVVRERHVQDGGRITCSGALAAFDLMADLIGERHGQALRMDVANLFMSREAGGGPALRPGRGTTVARAVAMMQANIEEPLSIGALARAIGRGQRHLEVRMRAEFGATPQAVYRRVRLSHARRLVQESDLPVAEVALRSGYQDASAMTRAFRSEFGATPQQLRRAG